MTQPQFDADDDSEDLTDFQDNPIRQLFEHAPRRSSFEKSYLDKETDNMPIPPKIKDTLAGKRRKGL
jgi:hypothetical protein